MPEEERDANVSLRQMSKVLFKDYQSLFKEGRKIYSRFYTIYWMIYPQFTVKTAARRKVGKAVLRNYEKRVIREVMLSLKTKKNYFLLIICNSLITGNYQKKRKILLDMVKPLMLIRPSF